VFVFFFITDELRAQGDESIEASPNLFSLSPTEMTAIDQLP
jgi:hypothetical protein